MAAAMLFARAVTRLLNHSRLWRSRFVVAGPFRFIVHWNVLTGVARIERTVPSYEQLVATLTGDIPFPLVRNADGYVPAFLSPADFNAPDVVGGLGAVCIFTDAVIPAGTHVYMSWIEPDAPAGRVGSC